MKILNRIRAFFIKDNAPVMLELSAAEIKNGRAFLHPKGVTDVTYIVRSDDVEIRLSDGKSLSDTDIRIIGREKKKVETPNDSPNKTPLTHNGNSKVYSLDLEKFKKKTFSVSLYQHEYDALVSTIKEYGYRRADFILASAHTATKSTMAREHKKLLQVHKDLHKEEKTAKESRNIS